MSERRTKPSIFMAVFHGIDRVSADMTGESRPPKLVEPGREERAARVETAIPKAGCACLAVVCLRCSAGVRRLGWRSAVGLADDGWAGVGWSGRSWLSRAATKGRPESKPAEGRHPGSGVRSLSRSAVRRTGPAVRGACSRPQVPGRAAPARPLPPGRRGLEGSSWRSSPPQGRGVARR